MGGGTERGGDCRRFMGSIGGSSPRRRTGDVHGVGVPQEDLKGAASTTRDRPGI